MQLRFSTAIAAAALAALSAASCLAADHVLVLATTTSTENTGLLAYLHPDFEAKTGLKVKVIAKGTGASLQLGRDGNADVVLVHARAEEDRFVAEGHGVMRRDVMYNDFIIIGPAADPAQVKDAPGPAEALARIAQQKRTFISRGDASGTHVKEQELWRASGLPLLSESITVFAEGRQLVFTSVRPAGDPSGQDWYLSIGQGMGKAITVATEKQAYTLADRGTYYTFALAEPPKTDLAILHQSGELLRNPYGVIAVNPQKHPGVNFTAAGKYVEWLTSPRVQQMIADYRPQGKQLFYPSALPPDPR